MTENATTEYQTTQHHPDLRQKATGLAAFAGVVMIVAGAFHVISGIVALIANEFYVSTPNYVFAFDTTRWGWIHLLLGLLVLVAGFAVLAGQTWGRMTGIVVAALSAVANFAFIPYYPFWSLTIIALDVIVIWALATHDRNALT